MSSSKHAGYWNHYCTERQERATRKMKEDASSRMRFVGQAASMPRWPEDSLVFHPQTMWRYQTRGWRRLQDPVALHRNSFHELVRVLTAEWVSDGYLVLINAAFSLPHLDSKLTSNLGFFYWNSADNVAISKIVELLAIFLLFCKVVSDESNRGLPSSFKPRTLRSLEVWRITVSPLSLHPWGEDHVRQSVAASLLLWRRWWLVYTDDRAAKGDLSTICKAPDHERYFMKKLMKPEGTYKDFELLWYLMVYL